ncbi:putative carboxylesterase 16 [Dorcoceras hygrometricum]|uniref:Putative carboxylesterase 16 n=1 Tax=Dorcoceras hygrometricum TaxID=472368 RepID=A0A2Z7AF51_9LAMI|nr:putative carboxylesterase 16 [Dorcoceras hygrometricum]
MDARVVALDSSFQDRSSYTSFVGFVLAGRGSRRKLPCVGCYHFGRWVLPFRYLVGFQIWLLGDRFCGNFSSELSFDDVMLYVGIEVADLVGDQLGMEQSWSLEAAQEQERTEQAQLQTKRGTDAEVAPEDQLDDKNK